MVTRGVDVSAFQPKPRWGEIAEAGAEFAIVKVTQGNTYSNPYAAAQVDGSTMAGLLTMLYHFAAPNGPEWLADAKGEAQRLDQIADVFEQKHGRKFFCWLDVERNEPLTDAERPLWRMWARTFREECRARGRAVGWYSYRDFTSALALEAEWVATLLWLARYPIPFRADGHYPIGWPGAPLPWGRPDVWQDGGDANGARWPGIDGPADVDAFAGSRAELEELISVAA